MATYQRLRSGKWRCIIRKRGHYESRSFATKAEAKRYASAKELELDRREIGLVTPKTVTVADLLKSYMQEVDVRSSSTITVYRRIMRSDLGAVRVRDLSARHVDAYVAEVLKRAKPETARIYLSLLNKVGRWARAVKGIDWPDRLCSDAIARLKFNGHKLGSNARDRIATETELNRLYDHWRSEPSDLPMTEIVQFAVETCMRVSEICSIVGNDYSHNAKTIWVRSRKNGRDLEAPLRDAAVRIVEGRLASGFHDRLFPYNSKLVSRTFSAACHSCGIDDLRFHDLRHTGITRYALKGLKMQELQLISGHRSITSLARYVNLRPNDIHARLAELEAERQRLIKSLAAE